MRYQPWYGQRGGNRAGLPPSAMTGAALELISRSPFGREYPSQLTVTRDNDVLDAPIAFDPILNPLPALPLRNRSVPYENRRTALPDERDKTSPTLRERSRVHRVTSTATTLTDHTVSHRALVRSGPVH
jgi:hypothetical protein